MRLICDLLVNNLEYAGLSAGKQRPKKCQLSVVKNESSQLAVVVQSPDNKQGTRYKITGNVAQLFERFILEGKCTIRLKSPSLDLILSKCDVMQLKLFLKTVKSGDLIAEAVGGGDKQNKNGKRIIENLPSVQKKLKVSNFNEKCRTKLTILNRKELTTTSFSQTLVELRLSGLDLTVIPPSIGKLTKLQVLDLSENKLTDFPKIFAGKLIELNLKQNLFCKTSQKAWKFFSLSNIRLNLQNLNLSNNELPALPLQLLGLERLSTLCLAGNKIKKFASKFGELKKLMHLDISNNNIFALDISFQMLRLAHLDVTKAFSSKLSSQQGYLVEGVPSLRCIASAFVRNRRLNHCILPVTVQEDLLIMRRCRCYKVVAHTMETIIDFPVNNLAQTCVTDGLRFVKMHSSLCNECLRLHQNKQK